MLVFRVRAGDGEAAHLRFVKEGEEGLQVDVIAMRPFPVSPTQVQPDLLRRDIGDGSIQSIHVELDPLEKLAFRPVQVHDLALEGEIRSIELQDVTAGDDQLVLLLHVLRQGVDVFGVGRVGGVIFGSEEGRGEDPRRGCGNEGLGELRTLGCQDFVEEVEFLPGLTVVVYEGVDALGHAPGRRRFADGVDSRALRHQRREIGELGKICHGAAVGKATKARHPVLGVDGKAQPGNLAVASDVDTRSLLLADRFANLLPRLLPKCVAIHGLALFDVREHCEERVGAGKAPDMGREDAVLAEHESSFLGHRG